MEMVHDRMNTPKVSIIMPVYNASKYLSEAIKSVLNQKYHNLELIIINDASTDNSKKIIKHFLYDNRILYNEFHKNKGVATARNRGLTLASGKYISFLDADDVWLSDKIYKQVAFMQSHHIDFSYSYYSFVNTNGDFIKDIKQLPHVTDFKNIIYTNSIPILTVMISQKIMKPFSFPVVHHEDYALWLEMLTQKSNSLRAYLIPKILAKYRIHKNSISSNKIESGLWVWNLYYNFMHFSLLKSTKCIIMYLWYGLIKHFQ